MTETTEDNYFVKMHHEGKSKTFYKDYPKWKDRQANRDDWMIDASVQNEREMCDPSYTSDPKEIDWSDIHRASSICDTEYSGGRDIVEEILQHIKSSTKTIERHQEEIRNDKKKFTNDAEEIRRERCKLDLLKVYLKLIQSNRLIFDEDRREHYLEIARRLDELIHEY